MEIDLRIPLIERCAESTSCDDNFLMLSLVQKRKLSQLSNRAGQNPEYVVNILVSVLLTKTEADVDYVLGVLSGAVAKLRQLSPLNKAPHREIVVTA